MIPTIKLLQLTRRNNIKIRYVNMPDEVAGYYGSEGSLKIILLNKKLKNNIKILRSTLAKQLGYFFTMDEDTGGFKKNNDR